MIIVDSSVWVDYFTGVDSKQTNTFDKTLGLNLVAVGDVIIASFCIDQKLPLLFSDKDFNPFVKHLGLVDA